MFRSFALRTSVATQLALLAVVAVGTGVAHAHAELLTTNPRGGAVVKKMPSSVTVTFTGPIKSKGSSLVVNNSAGKRVSTRIGRRDPKNVKRLTVPMKSGLGNGRYVVRWTFTSADGHRQSGSYSFRVKR
jgi:methionine-rich copper-binding protein CopC